MAIYSYSLPNVVVPSGTLQTTLFCTLSSLSVPTNNLIVDPGDVVERIEESVGVIRLAEMSVDLIEDYSSYSQGFWYKVISSGDFQLQFFLDEGAGSTYFFWGTTVGETEQVNENYIVLDGSGVPVNGGINRSYHITLASMLRFVDVLPWSTFMSNASTFLLLGGGSTSFISFQKLIYSCFFNAYRTTDVYAVYPRGMDIQFNGALTSNLSIDNLFMGWAFATQLNDYIHSTAQNYFPNRYATPLDLLGAVCRNFGFLPRYYYDITNSKHSLELLTRGSWDTNKLTMPPLKRPSVFQMTTDMQANNFQITAPESGAVPANLGIPSLAQSYDFQRTIDFDIGNGYTSGFPLSGTIFEYYSGSYTNSFLTNQFYNYLTKAIETVPAGYSNGRTLDAALFLYYKKFSKPSRMVQRTYKGIAPTESGVTSQAVMYPTKITDIHDGVLIRTYYANEVRKSVKKHELYVEWLEV